MKSEDSCKSGLSSLVENVNTHNAGEQKVQKITSNEMFKNALMGFIDKELTNIDDNNIVVLTSQQNQVNQKLFDLIDEDSFEVSDLMRFSEMLSKQKNMENNIKNSRINALFDILKPTKDSANPLLNNDRSSESENEVTNGMSSNELGALFKMFQLMSASSNGDEKDSE